LNKDGLLRAYNSSLDIGQGSETVLRQILSEESGLQLKDIELRPLPKDGNLEDTLGSVASRTTYLIGTAMQDAAKKLNDELRSIAAKQFDVEENDVDIFDGEVHTVEGVTLFVDALLKKADRNIEISHHAESEINPPGYGVHFAEVEIDTETGAVNLTTFVAAQDVGFAINPQLVEGQIEGAIQHSIEFALYSEVQFDHGSPINTNLADYPAISPWEMPDQIVCEIVESNEETGPYGAKGLGTPVMTPIAPAILNAIRDATGIRFSEPPVRSEDIYLKLMEAEE